MSKRNKLLILSAVILAIIIALIGTSYAYFTSNVTGNEVANQTVITSGNMRLALIDGDNITLNNAIPGDSVKKTFSVENTGTVETKYDIYFSELCNIFVDKTDLVYTIRHTSANGYELLTETEVPNSSGKIINSQSIAPNETQTYEITIKFLNKDENQDDNQGAYFSTKLNINDYKGALHCSKYNNEVEYYLDGRKVEELPNNIGHTYSTSSCTNNAEIVWDNNNWSYNVDYDSSTGDSVCSIYFINKISKLTINPNGGTWEGNIGSQEYNKAYSETMDIPNPTKEGYTFVNWTINGSGTTINNNTLTMGYEETTLIANYNINQYTLTINADGGSYSGQTTITQDYNTTTNISTPTRSGYTFKGWSTPTVGTLNESTYTFGAGNEALIAQWEANDYAYIAYHYKQTVDGTSYTLVDATADHNTYLGKYGSQVTPPVRSDSFITGFTAPQTQTITIREDVTSVNETPTVNVVNYNYTRNKYNLTINPNNGSSNTTEEMYYEAEKTITPPTKNYYNFNSWSGGTVTDNTFKMGTRDVTLTATYTPINYTITYNLDGGSLSGQTTSYNVETTSFTIPEPTKTGYRFDGWTGTDLSSATKSVTVSTGSHGNRTYTANWTEERIYLYRTGDNSYKNLEIFHTAIGTADVTLNSSGITIQVTSLTPQTNWGDCMHGVYYKSPIASTYNGYKICMEYTTQDSTGIALLYGTSTDFANNSNTFTTTNTQAGGGTFAPTYDSQRGNYIGIAKHTNISGLRGFTITAVYITR